MNKFNHVLASAAVAVGISSAAAPAKDVTVRVGTTLPDIESPSQKAFKAMSEYIAFRSNGLMKVEIFWGGTLGGGR